jgi:hypothetical protein
MTARTGIVNPVEPAMVDQATIDEGGALHLPPDILALLRPDGERLTLVDVEAKDGVLVLRRSSIPEDDWWAYTPEVLERHARAMNRPRDQDLHLGQRDLERLAGLEPE